MHSSRPEIERPYTTEFSSLLDPSERETSFSNSGTKTSPVRKRRYENGGTKTSPVRKWRYENGSGTKMAVRKRLRYENGGTKTAPSIWVCQCNWLFWERIAKGKERHRLTHRRHLAAPEGEIEWTYILAQWGWTLDRMRGNDGKTQKGIREMDGICNRAAEERFSQLQNDQKIQLEKQQKEQSKATAEQLPKIVEKIIELDKEPKQKRTKAFQEELEKKVMEQIDVTVQTKVDKMEMANEQQKVVTEKAIFERIGELEGQQKHQKQQGEKETKASEERFSQLQNNQKKLEKEQKQLQKENIVSEDHLKAILERIAFLQSQNDQKKLLEKISEIEKEQKQKKVLLKFQENCWDSFASHNELKIIGDKSLFVHYKGPTDWRSVFAKYPIVLNKHLSDFFYYEISVQKKEKNWSISFGFAVKQQTKLDRAIRCEIGTYAYENYGQIWINGEGKGTNDKYSYGVGDTVGIGVHFATRQIIFTKNGLRLDISDFFVSPSFADGSFYPFVSLRTFGDKIEANFGPNFKFDLATL
ncbi:hypothetical protein niasHT_014575 [Heterodera trifolii]|uniref:B30.2/SPRY domain-containing protein n=1 Tax=Heterodera trifolii TaxID=157864 RepID=A0ABD2LI28_9BILA